MNSNFKIVIIILCICIIGVSGYIMYDKNLKIEATPVNVNQPIDEPGIVKSNDFNYNLILNHNAIVEKNKNYLISPYSIEIALNMLRDGASGDTKNEIEKTIGLRKINNVFIKDRVNVANSIFMNNTYEKDVLSTYKDNLKNNYDAELFTYKYDELVPKINSWVNKKTNGMINKILNSNDVDENFVLGLLNALTIDVEWLDEFSCDSTISEEFTKINGTKINVEMMHQRGYKYIKESDLEGIVLPYKKYDDSNVELEFVGLIPKGNLDDYINNNLEKDMENLSNLVKIPIDTDLKEQIVNLSLPRFTYDYEIKKEDNKDLFKNLLENMGIKKAFIPAKYYGDKDAAEFENMVDIKSMILKDPSTTGIHISKSIHKTHIELMEKGTKAAAVTYFGMVKDTGMAPIIKEYEYINIKFNKPFIYMIREKNTNEMLFFGVVYEPNLWKGSTCSNNK